MMKHHDFSVGHSGVDEAIDNYLMYGYEPGGFTRSLLSNDLSGAVNGADHWNKENLVTVVQAIQQWMPGCAWGSREIVDAWLKDEDGRRTDYALRQEKLYMLRVIKGNVKKEQPDYPF
jgi:hypothetical protein